MMITCCLFSFNLIQISRVKSIDSLGSITQLELSIIGLSVEDDLLWISTILDASPLLEKLSVSVMVSW